MTASHRRVGSSPFRLELLEDRTTPAGFALATVAGTGAVAGTTDPAGDGGPATAAQLGVVDDVAVDAAGDLFIADYGSGKIRRVDGSTGVITTFAGTGGRGSGGDGGPATAAQLDGAAGVAVDAAGNVYVVVLFTNKVRRIDGRTGVITTFAGNGTAGAGGDGGPATAAQLNRPQAVAVDAAGNVYIAESENSKVRRVDAKTGVITTLAGTGPQGSDGDGGPAAEAQLGDPSGLAVDQAGDVYIADTLNRTVRRVDARTGVITTVAGNGQQGSGGDGGPATAAQFIPLGVAVDRAGNLYVSEALISQNDVRRVDAATGVVTTVATAVNGPGGLSADAAGDIFIADGNNHVIRKLTPVASVPPTPPAEVGLIGQTLTVVGAPDGTLQALNSNGVPVAAFSPFPGFAGEVRVAAAAGGLAAAGTGPGRLTEVKLLDTATQAAVFDVTPFESTFTGGLFLSTGDLMGTGTPDVVVSPDQGGGPRVQVRNGKTGAVEFDFFGIDDPNFRGGARTAVADITGDGVPDLVVAAGFGGGPRVSIYDGAALRGGRVQKVADFFVFEQTLRNGAYVAAGDLDGDRSADLIVGGGPGGGPRVFALSGKDITAGSAAPAVLANFFAGDAANRGGVRVAVKNLDGDARADLLAAPGPGGGSRVTAYAGKAVAPSGVPPALFGYDDPAAGVSGVYVG